LPGRAQLGAAERRRTIMGTKKVTDQEILKAARAMFVEHGLLATMREIAGRAGCSAATISARFGSKHALFLRAVESEAPPWAADLPAIVGLGDLRSNLESLAVAMVRWFRRVAPLAIVAWSLPSTADSVDLTSLRGEPELAAFFEKEYRLGRARWYDAERAARAFAALVWDVALDRDAEWTVVPSLSPLWGGLAPREVDPEPPSSRPGPARWPLDAAALEAAA
jgi:AcrR family transcriptional regulator